MIVGVDVLNQRAEAAVRTFAEQFQVPVISTYKAKGVLPEDHALALGGAGLSPLADRHLLPFVQAADLILCVGYDPIEMRPGWRHAWDPAAQRVIDITAAPNTHYMHQGTLNFVTDCAPTLKALADGVGPRDTWAEGEIYKLKTALAAAFPGTKTGAPQP